MTNTTNSYNSGLGELAFTTTAADVTALAALTTAETIVIDGAVVKFEEVTGQARPASDLHTLGDREPINAMSDHVNSSVWELTLVDDYHAGLAGEWGTDLLSAVELFRAYFDATPRRAISDLAVTPAGGATGDIETTLKAPIKILSISEPKADANSSQDEMIVIRLSSSGKTKAAHA